LTTQQGRGFARVVERYLGLEHRPLGGLPHSIHAPDDAHQKNHIRVLPALEEIAQDIVGNAPDEGNNFVVRCLIYYRVRPFSIISSQP